jgi:hypothetical protein
MKLMSSSIAAATMYQRAKRLASLPLDSGLAFDILTTQCQSYLIAINALELQAADKQWILVGAEGTQQSQKVHRNRFYASVSILTRFFTDCSAPKEAASYGRQDARPCPNHH